MPGFNYDSYLEFVKLWGGYFASQEFKELARNTIQEWSTTYASGDPKMDLLMISSVISLFSFFLLLAIYMRRRVQPINSDSGLLLLKLQDLENILTAQKSEFSKISFTLKAECGYLKQELLEQKSLLKLTIRSLEDNELRSIDAKASEVKMPLENPTINFPKEIEKSVSKEPRSGEAKRQLVDKADKNDKLKESLLRTKRAETTLPQLNW